MCRPSVCGRVSLLKLLKRILEIVFHAGLDLDVKVNCRIHQVNVLLQMGRHTVFLASYVWLASLRMFVDIVFGLEELLGFINSCLELKPVKGLRLLDTCAVDAR